MEVQAIIALNAQVKKLVKKCLNEDKKLKAQILGQNSALPSEVEDANSLNTEASERLQRQLKRARELEGINS